MLFYKLKLFRHLGKRNTIKIVFSSACRLSVQPVESVYSALGM